MVVPVDTTSRLTIGELARRTGLSVRTVRFYSDAGVVPESARSPAGYRLYAAEAVARLETAVALRELGFDLDTVRRLLDRRVGLEGGAPAGRGPRHADRPPPGSPGGVAGTHETGIDHQGCGAHEQAVSTFR